MLWISSCWFWDTPILKIFGMNSASQSQKPIPPELRMRIMAMHISFSLSWKLTNSFSKITSCCLPTSIMNLIYTGLRVRELRHLMSREASSPSISPFQQHFVKRKIGNCQPLWIMFPYPLMWEAISIKVWTGISISQSNSRAEPFHLELMIFLTGKARSRSQHRITYIHTIPTFMGEHTGFLTVCVLEIAKPKAPKDGIVRFKKDCNEKGSCLSSVGKQCL